MRKGITPAPGTPGEGWGGGCVEGPFAKSKASPRTPSLTLPRNTEGGKKISIPFVLSFAICLLVWTWFVTWGDWRLFDHERFGGYYDAQARAILYGRLDVPPEAIGFEAFVRESKSYGYFGIAPALLRIPLVVLFPSMDGRWSRLMTLVAVVLTLCYAYRLLTWASAAMGTQSSVNSIVKCFFVLSAGLGSTLPFLASRSYAYHEAILWGAAFSLMCAYYLVQYLSTSRAACLALAGLFAFAAFLSRATAGAGALLAMTVLAGILLLRAMGWAELKTLGRVFGLTGSNQDSLPFPSARSSRAITPHAMIACGSVVLTIGVYLGINYAKFKTFDGVPVRYYSLYIKDPQRMQVTGGKQVHPENLRTGLLAYFGLGSAEVSPQFPWVYMTTQPRVFPEAAIDVVEPHSSIPLSMPALFVLAVMGCGAIVKGDGPVRMLRLPAIALFLGGAIILMTVGITERYLHDLYPLLIITAAAGACRLAASRSLSLKLAGLAPLVLLGILVNAAFAFDFQREIVWGVPQSKRAELTAIRHSIDQFFGRPSAMAKE